MSVFVFLELEGLGLGLELGLGVGLGASQFLIADCRYATHGNRVLVRWVLLYVYYHMTLQFFQDKCGLYHCILAYNFVLYITCSYVLENDYIFKSFVASKWNISNSTSKCTVDLYE